MPMFIQKRAILWDCCTWALALICLRSVLRSPLYRGIDVSLDFLSHDSRNVNSGLESSLAHFRGLTFFKRMSTYEKYEINLQKPVFDKRLVDFRPDIVPTINL